MAGLIKDNFKEEILTELSWIMTAIDDLSTKCGIETYETVLIKHRVQPEEERAIEKFFVLNIQKLDNLTIEEIQTSIAHNFFEMTQKEWAVSNDIVEKLIQLKRAQLGV